MKPFNLFLAVLLSGLYLNIMPMENKENIINNDQKTVSKKRLNSYPTSPIKNSKKIKLNNSQTIDNNNNNNLSLLDLPLEIIFEIIKNLTNNNSKNIEESGLKDLINFTSVNNYTYLLKNDFLKKIGINNQAQLKKIMITLNNLDDIDKYLKLNVNQLETVCSIPRSFPNHKEFYEGSDTLITLMNGLHLAVILNSLKFIDEKCSKNKLNQLDNKNQKLCLDIINNKANCEYICVDKIKSKPAYLTIGNYTPLELAIILKNLKVVSILLKNGAHANESTFDLAFEQIINFLENTYQEEYLVTNEDMKKIEELNDIITAVVKKMDKTNFNLIKEKYLSSEYKEKYSELFDNVFEDTYQNIMAEVFDEYSN